MNQPHDLSFELHDLVRTMDEQAAAVLKPLGMTLRQHTALVVVGDHPGLRGRDLAAALGITPAGATGLVKTLANAGLVADAAPRGSGNRQALELTTSGREALAASTQALSGSFDEMVRRAGHDPLVLARALREVHDLLRSDPAGT